MDPKSPDIFLQFAIRLRNYGAAPVKCQITKADIRIEDRALPEYKKMKPSYLPRGGCKDMRLIPFKRSSLQEFFGKKQKGTAEFIIIYGHPEEPPVREMRVKAELHIALSDDGDNLGFVAGAVDERDISFVGDESSYD